MTESPTNSYMYIPAFLRIVKTPDTRVAFLISFTSAITITLSLLYTLLLVIGILFDKPHTSLPLSFGLIVSSLFVFAGYLNIKHYSQFSLRLIITTLLTVCCLSGILWGFDMPSVLLGYVMACVLVSTTTGGKSAVIYVLLSITSILLGHNIRLYNEISTTWHNMPLTFDDILEFTIILFYIMSLLFFSNREQQKLLTRSLRSEGLLQKERDSLCTTLESRTLEIKRLQMDHISHMYRFVEFGKMASGLFHDLISPIQTLKIQIEAAVNSRSQLTLIKKTSDRLELMMNTLRKQIRFDDTISSVDILQETRDIIYITQYLHVSNNISVELISTSDSHTITTNKAILNHVIQNLLSNACEACIPVINRDRTVSIYVGHQNMKTYISIVDNGIGISEPNLEKVFEPFYSSKTKSINQSNCGIGLSSAKHAVEKYLGGKIFCESQVDVGTTMTIII